jgi:hypothetical protein
LSKSIAAAKRVAAARIAVISAKCSSTKGRYRTELCGLPSICRWLRGPFSPLLFQKFHGIGRSPLDGSAFAPMMTPVSRWVPPRRSKTHQGPREMGPNVPRRGNCGPLTLRATAITVGESLLVSVRRDPSVACPIPQ